jgi:hypothetical protein
VCREREREGNRGREGGREREREEGREREREREREGGGEREREREIEKYQSEYQELTTVNP